ncbi:hypothetical protein SISSUDRAFT_188445 [Sistotremastrum suecicum HHB10207 ss-3]|uniref:Microtubule associated protein n=1 Tax=Sistotremastrum suecicum HHB10207 ss-3 TaxID=1314776 RepID=A0A166AF49_9AGAM|nr:hypothetical protein SISSUDRAFT_188445 [Sistotremastrum suecicum HHB10207 ss-3]
MSVPALLEALQSHLHTQTSLLPELHAQLGLPSTSLTEDLRSLQQSLTECVERLVTSRKNEVEQWLSKCSQREDDCRRLIQSIGSGAGPDFQGIQNLPKRLEALEAHLTRLQHIYATKQEQLASLQGRIHAQLRVLGNQFSSLDPKDLETAGNTSDVQDVTSERFARLEKELVRGKTELSRLMSWIKEKFDHVEWLYGELGMSPPSPSDPFIVGLDETSSFIRAFITYRDSESLEGIEPTNNLISWIERTTSELEELKVRRESQIQGMYDQLEGLWRRLGVDEREIDEFVEAWRGSTEAVMEAYESELERMLELKRSTMSVFIGNARQEIEGLWDDLMIGEEERGCFAPFGDDEHTEELFILHEEEIRRLKHERKRKAPLLAAIRKYAEICEEEKELNAAASDQSRLLGRGPRDPGRLLREEKMRKRVTKEKPRLEQDLLTSIPQWEAENRKPFLVNGVSIMDVLKENIASDPEKENKKRPRPGSVPTHATTPASGKGIVATTPGASEEPNKRPRIGGSAARSHKPNVLVTPTPSHGNNHGRQVLGSRSSALNGMSSAGLNDAKTPSSLPRPSAGYLKNHTAPKEIPPPVPAIRAHKVGGDLGLGSVLGSSIMGLKQRSASASSANNASVSNGSKLQAKARRESFRPRASVDLWNDGVTETAGNKWSHLGAIVTEEEEE